MSHSEAKSTAAEEGYSRGEIKGNTSKEGSQQYNFMNSKISFSGRKLKMSAKAHKMLILPVRQQSPKQNSGGGESKSQAVVS